MKDYWKGMTFRILFVIALLLYNYFINGIHDRKTFIISILIIIVYIPFDYFWEKWKRTRINKTF